MALYGVTVYGEDVYGLSLPPAYMCTPFTATSVDYGTIRVTWTQPSGAIFRYRLISNRYGYPVTQNDGDTVIDSIPFPGTVYTDRQVIPGSYHYYGIWVLVDEVDDIWVCGGVTSCLAIMDFGSAWTLWNKIPEFFRSNAIDGSELTGDASGLPYLAQFLNILGWGFDYLHTQYAVTAYTLNSPMNCSLRDLWNLAGELGLSFSPQIPAYTVRKAVANWAHICRERGTTLGLRNEIELRTGWGADLTSGANIMLQNDQSLLLGPVYLPYQQRCYDVGEIVWWTAGYTWGADTWRDWTRWQWPGYGYWYKCIQVCPPGAPPGDGTSTGYWSAVTDEDDFTGLMTNPRTGNPSTWEVLAPAQTSSLLPPGNVRQGLGVLAPDGNGRAWNTLRFYNGNGTAQNIQCRSISRGTADIATMPDPSFESGYTLPPEGCIVTATPWIPANWPRILFDFGNPAYPGQHGCGSSYNTTAFWTFTNLSFTRTAAAAHTGNWGVQLATDTAGNATAQSPWVACPPGEAITGSLWIKPPSAPVGPAVNLLPDPEFQKGTGGWFCTPPNQSTEFSGLSVTGTSAVSQSAANPYDTGTYSAYALSFTTNAQQGSSPLTTPVYGPLIPVTPGLSYTFTGELQGTAITAIALNWLNAQGTVVGSLTNSNIDNTAYAGITLTGTAPASAVNAQFAATCGTASWFAHLYFGLSASYATCELTVTFADQDGLGTSYTTAASTPATATWTQYTITQTSPANTKYVWYQLTVTGAQAGDELYLDDCTVSTGVAFPPVPDPSVVIADGIDVPWVRPSQAWNAATRYVTGDLVLYQGQPFQALRASTGITPPVNYSASTEWAPLSENRRIRLCVSAYTSQNMTNSGTYQYPVVPYVEWYDSDGNFITSVLARSALNNGSAGKPNNFAFDSFTGMSRVESLTLTAADIGPWQATFYPNEELLGPYVSQRWDPFIDFYWDVVQVVEFLAITGWSATWVTTYTPNTTGVFEFSLTGTAGGSRFIVDGQTVVNNWTSPGASSTVTLDLVAGTPVTFEVDYTVPVTPYIIGEWGINIFPLWQPEWLIPWPRQRFLQWTTVPCPVIAGFPFQCNVQTIGTASWGQLTWYLDGDPQGITEIIYADDLGMINIYGSVPGGCNYVTLWISEDGRFLDYDRTQNFQHQQCEPVTTGLTLSAPTITASTGNTQFTRSLPGRYTDDQSTTWSVPVGSWDVGDFAGGATWPAVQGDRSIALITGPASTSLGVTFRSAPQSGQSMGIVFRYTTTNTYFRCDQTTLKLSNGGTWTTLATHSTPFAVDDRMVVVLNGSTIEVYRNNNMATPVSTATSTVNETATSHGLIVENT